MNKEEFVSRYFPLAQDAGKRFSMNPAIILAQAALESAWGTSYGALVRNNFFGITASGSPNEFWDGSFSVSKNLYQLKFREYATARDSFMDFARLISQRYQMAHQVSHDSARYARAIAYSPYIDESNGDNREDYRRGILSSYREIVDIIKKKELT